MTELLFHEFVIHLMISDIFDMNPRHTNRLRYNHQQIRNLLNEEKDFLLNLSDDFGSLSPSQFRNEVQKRVAEIDRAFVKTRKVKSEVCANGCHFVKNGTYKRGTLRVQNYICKVCGKLKGVDRVRSYFDGYLRLRLVQLKLEGVPMKWISKLLSIDASKLDYQWRVLSRKSLQQLIDMDVKSNFQVVAYNPNDWTDADGRLRSQLEHWEKPYKIELPIDYDRVLVIWRYIKESDFEKYKQVRLAQIMLMMRFVHHRPMFGPDDKLCRQILNTQIKTLVRLPHDDETNMYISNNSRSENQGKKQIPFNIRFDFDRSEPVDLGDIALPRWKRVSVTF